ncbi:MAG TPA: hypothetical protein VGB78_02770 [Thermoplasmata archaeon]
MRKDKERESPNRSTDSSKHPVDAAILRTLSSGVKSADSLKAEVISSTRCSPAIYYKRLSILRDDLRGVVFRPKGRRKYYALPQDEDRLAQYAGRQTDIEQRVVKSARYLADYMMTEARYDSRNPELDTSLYFKFIMLGQYLDMLRKTQPNIPDFKGRLNAKSPSHAIVEMHQFVLEVLQYFKAI